MKTKADRNKALNINLSERNLSILIHSLFSSWMLAFLFQGLVFQALAITYAFDFVSLTLWGGTGIFSGLLLSGIFIKTKEAAKRLFLFSYMFFMLSSLAFFFPPSVFWTMGIIISSVLAGGCVAAWGFYLKSSTSGNDRIKAVADMLILSNIIMILLNMTAIHISPPTGLVLSMAMLFFAFILSLKLPVNNNSSSPKPAVNKNYGRIGKHLAFLYLFIAIITINSGIMYYVISPAFSHLEWLTSWYWAIPYVVALYIMKNLPSKVNREYILYVAIAMIGLSFIGFIILDRSIFSYIVVNTLMLGAFGIYDLFWWSILAEMLDYDKNPAKIFGIGLSANILGILSGGLICNTILSANINSFYPALLSITVVFITLILLSPLYRYISLLLKENTFSIASELSVQNKIHTDLITELEILSERECQVTSLLLQGKTYRTIANELYISENTVKYYVKNIYSKFNINSRAELIDIILKQSKSQKNF